MHESQPPDLRGIGKKSSMIVETMQEIPTQLSNNYGSSQEESAV
jgi:hypothetical protein